MPRQLQHDSESVRRRIEERTHEITRIRSTSGPPPDPDVLRDYEKVLPGSGQALFNSFLEQGRHRRRRETRRDEDTRENMRAEHRAARRGQLFAFAIVITAFGLSAWLGWLGHPTAAGVVGSGGLAAVVTAFLWRAKTTSEAPPKEDL